MSDKDLIGAALALAKNSLQSVEHDAARKLLNYDGEIYPRDGCAITLSTLLAAAGMDIAPTYQALAMGNLLKSRGWQVIPVGQQQAGDVGSTCGTTPQHGVDHVYFVLQRLNNDEMVVADNQASQPHFRWASGQGGKSPTRFFLRAA